MVHHFYEGFLESSAEYQSAQEFWRRFFRSAVQAKGRVDDWSPWGLRVYLDGSEVPRDLLPIFQVRSSGLDRAVQILQTPPESENIEIAAWSQPLRFFNETSQLWERTDELVISLALSTEAARLVRILLMEWMDQTISRERMEDIIREVLPPVAH
jgi:hypothetical protein